ncbi:MAG: hypothetical protein IJ489_03495 [Clostridia bacterium]|nr:hypothetical protein [Clostridia bacterium]
MKKLYMVVLWLIVIAIILSSCDIVEQIQTENTTTRESIDGYVGFDRTEPTPANDDTDHKTETTESTEETTSTSLEEIDRSFEKIASYPTMNNMTESKDFVLFDYRGTVFYYDKKSGEAYQYCFDESCEHTNWKECISLKFLMMDKYQSIVYSEYDHRFYSLRGEKLCSFSHEGDDVRIEYSFGESGNFDEFLYNCWNVCDLQVLGQYLYMLVTDGDTEKTDIYRYDLETKEMRLLSGELDVSLEKYLAYDDKIHYVYKENNKKVYRDGVIRDSMVYCFATLEMKRIYEWFGFDGYSECSIVRNGKCYVIIERDEAGHFQIVCWELENRKPEEIGDKLYKDLYGDVALLAVDDEYIYYSVQSKHPDYTELHALHIQTGMDTVVFQGQRTFKLENLRFLPDNQVLLLGSLNGSPVLYRADIHETGAFVNLKLLLK